MPDSLVLIEGANHVSGITIFQGDSNISSNELQFTILSDQYAHRDGFKLKQYWHGHDGTP